MNCNHKTIKIVRGNDTNWNGINFLTFNLNTKILDLSTFKAVFKLENIVKTIDDISSGSFEINLTAQETKTLQQYCNGVLQLIDENKRIATIESIIPFEVIPVVHGDAIATEPYTLNFDVKQEGETILNVNIEAGVSVEVGTTTTLPSGSDAYVENVGTNNHLVLNFGIPTGADGTPGADGKDGADGADGADATINGVNALTIEATDGITLVQSGNTATISGSALQTAINGKQDELESGVNIKTINNISLLGSGNIDIQGGGGGGDTTDVQINGTSITSSGVANIITSGIYNASTNPIATMSDIAGKQDTLVSGSNIKTVCNYTLLGEGNVSLSASDVGALPSSTTIANLTTQTQLDALNSGATQANISQIATNQLNISTINSLIPSQASANNKLTDKAYVDTSISTATATFRGTYTSLQTLQNTDGDRNDYAYYVHTDSAGNTLYDRYKYVGLPESRVPAGYTEMLSLQKARSATAYIDTGYKIQSTDKIYMKLYGWEYEATSYIVFGAIDNNGKYFRVEKQYLGGIAYIQTSNGSIGAANPYQSPAIVECYDGKVYASDINGDNKTLRGNLTLDTVDTNLFLFAYNNNDSSISRYPQWVKIGDFIVYDQNGNKKLELVPCQDNQGNNGYYDTVSETFIAPKDGTLLAQAITTDRWVYEYTLSNISFTSAQWLAINSGVTTQTVSNVATIQSLIPAQATSTNQLADKSYVDYAVTTSSATYKGTYTNLSDLQAVDGDKNDYAFYSHTDSSGNTVYDRYIYVGIPESRLPEGYTQVQSIKGNYIDTHLVPKLNWHFILTFSSPRLETVYDEPIFGIRETYTSYEIFKAGYTTETRANIGSGRVSDTLTNNDVHIVEVKTNGAVYFDGVQKGVLSRGSTEPTASIYLLAIDRTNQSPNIWTGQSSFYGLKIYDNEENLKMDLVPCVRDQDGSIGVYDLAGTINPDTNSPFYGGATSWTALSTDRWVYEYSINNPTFTPSQWDTINSGLTSTSLSTKQDTLVSGTNIKTINSTSLLGSGDIDTKSQTVTALSGTSIALVDNSINTLTPTGNTTFTLPPVTDTTVFHQILVQLDMSTVYTIDLGTTSYFGGTAPDLSQTGNYNLIYEYDNTMSAWVVGAVVKE